MSRSTVSTHLRWKRKVLRKLHDENHHNDELINKLSPKKFALKPQIGVSRELKTFLMKGYMSHVQQAWIFSSPTTT